MTKPGEMAIGAGEILVNGHSGERLARPFAWRWRKHRDKPFPQGRLFTCAAFNLSGNDIVKNLAVEIGGVCHVTAALRIWTAAKDGGPFEVGQGRTNKDNKGHKSPL